MQRRGRRGGEVGKEYEKARDERLASGAATTRVVHKS